MADGVVLDLYAEDLDKDFAGQAQVSQQPRFVYTDCVQMCLCTYAHMQSCVYVYVNLLVSILYELLIFSNIVHI